MRQARPGDELLHAWRSWGWRRSGACWRGRWPHRIGAPWTVALGGVACLVGAAFFARRLGALRAMVRPIYREIGILPPLEPLEETA